MVALWGESVSLSPLTPSDLRFSLATGSPFGPSSGLVAIRSPFFFLGLFPVLKIKEPKSSSSKPSLSRSVSAGSGGKVKISKPS